jgi:hypothetical protein
VKGPIPVALRNQVASWAKRAKFGYRRRSIRPRESSSDIIGNSSNSTTTTGALASVGTTTPGRPASCPSDSTSLPAGDMVINSRAKTRGAGVA